MSHTPAAFEPLVEGSYFARLAASRGVALVLFSAPGCGACRAWKALIPTALGDTLAQCFEVDVSVATGVARAFGIFHLPTVYLYRDGEFHAEVRCPLNAAALHAHVRALLDAPAEEEPG